MANSKAPAEPPSPSWRRRLEHRLPLNIAHRGASAAAPGNTLAAFSLAEELGADGIEFDVHLSADGIPVVIHDFEVDRTTDGSGTVSSMSVAELKELDAGFGKGGTYAGERIPTLDEVLDSVGAPMLLNIELKSRSMRSDRLASAVVSRLQHRDLVSRCLVSSFNPLSLRATARLSSSLLTGLLYSPDLPRPLSHTWFAPFVRHEARHPEHTMIDDEFMAWSRRRGLLVNAWTVDEPSEMRRLIGLRVDGIITNRPDILRAELAGRAAPANRPV